VPVGLTVTPTYPTADHFARPSETISFQLSTTTHEQVTYVADSQEL